MKTNALRIHSVLKSFHVTEKSSNAQGDRAQYAFKVVKDATKKEIKDAVELLFHVKVEKVCTVNKCSVVKRFRQRIGRRPGFKKAYVLLHPGQVIDVEGASA